MHPITRRDAAKFVGTLGASFAVTPVSLAEAAPLNESIKFGVIADLHGGLADDAESRLDAFLDAMKAEDCDALVQLGDFAFPNQAHQRFADKLNAAHDHTLHVIGNHEFDFGLKREDCYRAWDISSSYYRREIGGIRVLVLDGNDSGSPTHGGGYASYVGDQQRTWLENELKSATGPVLILSHQPLAGTSAIDNASDIQKLLAQYKSKILLCVNGHSHVDSLVQVRDVSYLHVNSASYYWVGGDKRMAYYSDPLFTTLTINPEEQTVLVQGKAALWKDESPKQIGYFDRVNAPPAAVVTPQIRPRRISRTRLKVMTWNIWGRLNQDSRYTVKNKTARQRTIEIIQSSGADIIAMIETYGSAADIAEALGFHHHTPASDANLCIFSRYPLSDLELLEDLNPFSFLAATVTLPGGQRIRIYDIWLTSGGRHLVDIKNDAISDETFANGDENRFQHLKQLLDHPVFQKDSRQSDTVPLVVAGDFNCVSHLDHTTQSRDRHLNHSRVLSIKASLAMEQARFIDSYRDVHPQITAKTLGHTWTTVGKDYLYVEGQGFVRTNQHIQPQYRDPYARIDYIYSRGSRLQTIDSQTLDRHPRYPEQMFPSFPSDHAAVVTEFRVLPPQTASG